MIIRPAAGQAVPWAETAAHFAPQKRGTQPISIT